MERRITEKVNTCTKNRVIDYVMRGNKRRRLSGLDGSGVNCYTSGNSYGHRIRCYVSWVLYCVFVLLEDNIVDRTQQMGPKETCPSCSVAVCCLFGRAVNVRLHRVREYKSCLVFSRVFFVQLHLCIYTVISIRSEAYNVSYDSAYSIC